MTTIHMKIFKRILIVFILVGILAGGAGLWLSDKYVVPIIMYHNVEDSDGLHANTVSPENFQRHMAYLKNNGYRVLSLNEFIEGVQQNKKFSRKSVVLTFDDGYENNFTYAFPVLRQYGFAATIFVAPDFVAREGFLNWQQIRQMQKQGIAYGSHGMTQGYLPDLSQEKQRFEIENSKTILEKELGAPIEYFAYPVGGFSDEIKKALKDVGYSGAVATNRGYDRFNKDVFELNRIRLGNKDNSGFILSAKLSGYYNFFRGLKNPY